MTRGMRFISFIVQLMALLVPICSHAYVELAFFERPRMTEGIADGEDRFYHVAISYQGQWLQALPYSNVMLWGYETLTEAHFGKMTIIAIPDLNEPTPEQVEAVKGLIFDRSYTWDKPGTTYCAKLVAQLLGFQPKPMTFADSHFANLTHRRGELGLSPDDIYEEVVARSQGRAQRRQCESVFAN